MRSDLALSLDGPTAECILGVTYRKTWLAILRPILTLCTPLMQYLVLAPRDLPPDQLWLVSVPFFLVGRRSL